LYLSHNQIETVPPSIGDLRALTVLTLSHNHIKTLPDTVKKLTNLFSLSLSGNPLEARPNKPTRGMLWFSLPKNFQSSTLNEKDYPDGLDPRDYPDDD